WPTEVSENGMVKFHVKPFKIETSIESAKKVFKDAVLFLGQEMPKPNPACEYCNLVAARKNEIY
ncbi:MAG: hypothetical protein KKA80_02065, partial [Candidatus Omnitrophica bacterium]|nr:hypothetical protein [Candidatus Omnitrophota bacterium]